MIASTLLGGRCLLRRTAGQRNRPLMPRSGWVVAVTSWGSGSVGSVSRTAAVRVSVLPSVASGRGLSLVALCPGPPLCGRVVSLKDSAA